MGNPIRDENCPLEPLVASGRPDHPPSPSQIVAGPISNPANGHWYYLVGPTYWTNAEAQAVGLGGHLVTINDAAENAWVLQTFTNYSELCIGLTDEGHEGQWTWISGEPVTYLNWNDGGAQ